MTCFADSAATTDLSAALVFPSKVECESEKRFDSLIAVCQQWVLRKKIDQSAHGDSGDRLVISAGRN
jgi:hypothetical protein